MDSTVWQWILGVSGSFIVASVCWLVRAVLRLEAQYIRLDTEAQATFAHIMEKFGDLQQNCMRHQKWSDELSERISRMDRNIVRLCQSADNVDYEQPPGH